MSLFLHKIYKLRRVRGFVFRCGPLLSAGTASASLPRQEVCRRCPQRTFLVGHHPPLCGGCRHVLGLRTARPTENVCSRRTRKATEALASHEENGYVFSSGEGSSAPNNYHTTESDLLVQFNHYDSEGNTRILL